MKARWWTDRLLIDMQASGCQKTTRISQAIQTLQEFLWSLRMGQLREIWNYAMPVSMLLAVARLLRHLALCDVRIPVPGEYLLPSLRDWQSEGFDDLLNVAPRRTAQPGTRAGSGRPLCKLLPRYHSSRT